MFRESPSSIRRAFSGGGLKAFRGSTKFYGTRKKRRLILGPHVSCPNCGSNFKTWIGVASHMVRSGPDHDYHIEELTGKVGALFYRPGGLKELAKILEDKYVAASTRGN
jgi:hypothetical protein